MAGKVILAVAGAGKTYKICQMIDMDKKNLILAFTHENIKNIENGLIKRFKRIPNKTFVMTFHSFVYQFLLRPYEFSFFKHFHQEFAETHGVSLSKPPEPSIRCGNSYRRNPAYVPIKEINHYLTRNGEYYCNLMSEAFMRMDKSDIKTIMSNFSLFFDCIYVDEFQDFRQYDYDLLMEICKTCPSVTMVGDFYQHSVSGVQNSGKPFQKRKRCIDYNEFIEDLAAQKIVIDNQSLQNSCRCSEEVCAFIRENIDVNIGGNKERHGKIIVIENYTNEEIKKIIYDDSIMKLVYKDASKQDFKCLNWSYSKGDTFSKTCIVLPDTMSAIVYKEKIKLTSRNRNLLYVALTRSSGDVYLLTRKRLEKILSTKQLNSYSTFTK